MGSIQSFNLHALREQFVTTHFVETGTYKGDGTLYALNSGYTVDSIEIDPQLYLLAHSRFKDEQSIRLHFGSSSDLLLPLLKSNLINCNTLFWLDAHFPFADVGAETYSYETDPLRRMPILKELESIVHTRQLFSDIIIIDDLRCFVDDDRIPAASFDDHMRSLGNRGFGCTRSSVVGITLEDILSVTSTSFKHQLIYKDEGYIVLTRN